jgi:hypothetical protein
VDDRRRLPRASWLIAITALVLLAPLWAPAATAAPAERLPDLRMALPADFVLDRSGAGRRLRMTTTILNVGDGPFEVRATRASRGAERMTVRQRIRRTDGTWTSRATGAVARYATDGHGHWHVQRVSGMELFATDGRAIRTGRKIGFCFFDTSRYRPLLPRSPSKRRYAEAGCGTRSSLRVTMGISVGWGDRYQATLAYQWIDVTGVPAGTYHVRVSADPLDHYRELRETNNCSWALVRLPATGSRVAVLDRGYGCAVPGGPDPTPTPTPTAAPTPIPTPTPAA